MKNFLIAFLSVFAVNVFAQQLNQKGLYVDSEGNLFTGVITSNANNINSTLSVKEEKVSGGAIYYFSSGIIMEKGNFTKGERDGKWERFNEKGNLNAVAFYSLGKKTGTWLVFDNEGHRRLEMNYCEGEKCGIWKNWDEQGTLASTKDYSLKN